MRKLIRQIKNFFSYGWALRNQYDWDNHYLEEIILLKLKRMRACFNSESFHHNRWSLKEELAKPDEEIQHRQGLVEQYKADVALDLCIRILERRMDDDVYSHISGLDKFEEDVVSKFENSEFVTLYKGEPISEEMSKKNRDLFVKTEEIKARDRKLLFQLMDKFSESWWS